MIFNLHLSVHTLRHKFSWHVKASELFCDTWFSQGSKELALAMTEE